MTAILAAGDLIPAGTLTATNALPGLPVTNAATPHVSQIMRAGGLSTQIDFDAGAAVSARLLALAGLEEGFGGLTTFTVKASTVSAGGTDALNWSRADGDAVFGVDALYRQAYALFGAAVSARYWRFNFTQSGGAAFELGRLFLAPVFSTSVTIGHPLAVARTTRSQFFEGTGGQRVYFPRPESRVISFGYRAASTATDVFGTLSRGFDEAVIGGRQAVLIPARDDARLGVEQMVLGYVDEIGAASHDAVGRFEKSYRMIEAR